MTEGRVVVNLGTLGQGKSLKAAELLKGHNRAIVIDSSAEYDKGFTIVRTPKELGRAVKKKRFKIAVRFSDEHEGFDWACRAAFVYKDMIVVVEEPHLYMSAAHAPIEFRKLARLSRHRGVTLVCVTQRSVDLWKGVLALASEMYLFNTKEPLDIKALAVRIGPRANELKDLKQFHYLHFKDGKVKNGKVKVPRGKR